jgi:hypothetical protein
MKTLKIRFNDEWLAINTHISASDENSTGILRIQLKANHANIFLDFTGLNNNHFKMFKIDDKLMYQFDNNEPIQSEYELVNGDMVMILDTNNPDNGFIFNDNEKRVKIFGE